MFLCKNMRPKSSCFFIASFSSNSFAKLVLFLTFPPVARKQLLAKFNTQFQFSADSAFGEREPQPHSRNQTQSHRKSGGWNSDITWRNYHREQRRHHRETRKNGPKATANFHQGKRKHWNETATTSGPGHSSTPGLRSRGQLPKRAGPAKESEPSARNFAGPANL